MKTSKPFSTISYNSVNFLTSKLTDLVSRRVIAFFAFVEHQAEEDERKNHIHLLIIPNGTYQTDALQDYLLEPDFSDLNKSPLGILPIQSSKWADWYLYACHDVGYLASKGQTRKFHYFEENFIVSNEDYFHELVKNIDKTKYSKTQEFVDQVLSGYTLSELLLTGQIPAPQFNQWRAMYDYLRHGDTYRNDNFCHTPKENKSLPDVKLDIERRD